MLMCLKTVGGSMRPLIRSNEFIFVKLTKNIMPGDVVAYKIGKDIFVHRIIKKNKNGTFVVNGDADTTAKHIVRFEEIIGKVRQPFWSESTFGLIYHFLVSTIFKVYRPIKCYTCQQFFF